ncbi:DUF748 domain-containing protein [Candidatus Omnitrophota bacterium]
MNVFKRIIVIALLLSVTTYVGICVFVWVKGKDLLSEKLSEAIGKEVIVGSLYVIPPYSISIGDLSIDGLLTIDRIKLEPSIAGLLAGQRGLNKLTLTKPKVSLVRIDNKLNINEVIDNIKSRRPVTKKKSKSNFFIKEAIIKGGEVTFYDKVADMSFGIMPLEMSVITSLKDFKTRINLEAQLVSEDRGSLGDISVAGWLNLLRKDMDAKLYLKDAEVAYFSPYFKKFFKNVKSGKLFLTADMVSQDNELTVDCHLETRDLKFSEETLIVDAQDKKITLFGNIFGLALDTLTGSASGSIFDFSIHTKFDRPRLEGLQLHGNIFKEPIKNIFKSGPEEGIEAIKKIGKDFEAIGKEFKEQFKDIGDMFKRQEEEDQGQPDAQASSEVQEDTPVPEELRSKIESLLFE